MQDFSEAVFNLSGNTPVIKVPFSWCLQKTHIVQETSWILLIKPIYTDPKPNANLPTLITGPCNHFSRHFLFVAKSIDFFFSWHSKLRLFGKPWSFGGWLFHFLKDMGLSSPLRGKNNYLKLAKGDHSFPSRCSSLQRVI